jgi:toxin ParE1/3/4
VSGILLNANNNYVVHPKADDDLEKIWHYTIRNWSIDRADQEIDELHSVFVNISLMPKMGREQIEVNPPVRIHIHGFHIIVYTVEEDFVKIVRVLGGRQDWLSILKQTES